MKVNVRKYDFTLTRLRLFPAFTKLKNNKINLFQLTTKIFIFGQFPLYFQRVWNLSDIFSENSKNGLNRPQRLNRKNLHSEVILEIFGDLHEKNMSLRQFQNFRHTTWPVLKKYHENLEIREVVMWWRTRVTRTTCHNKVTAINMEHFSNLPTFLDLNGRNFLYLFFNCAFVWGIDERFSG